MKLLNYSTKSTAKGLFLVKYGWVVLFMILCYMGYEQVAHRWNDEFSGLKRRLEVLTEQKNLALLIQEDLLLQINSQSDPEWVELTLMRGLGLVPDGQTKVYFSNINVNREIKK